MGLKCAGKKIHSVLLMEEKQTYAAKRFREECKLLCQVRHPNIVQFLGVIFSNEDEKIPIIVMEFLPMNLTDCIEKHTEIPHEITYSMLHDVALGLHYLHSYSPEPIIHRDLSSNNILLTPNMTAKISDLGVARIVNIPHEEARQLTKTPGTPAFMPPETMVENPIYDLSVDRFSYGVIMIHIFSGMWPEPDTQPICIVDETMEPVSEAKRRDKHLQKIGDHPLMELILKCIHNDPKERPIMEEIIECVSNVAAKFPASFDNEIDMFKHMETSEARRSAIQSTKQEKMLKVEEKLRELQTFRESMEQRGKRQRIELSKVQGQIADFQRKNDKLKADISSLKTLVIKHNGLLGNTHMLLQDVQQSITDFDEYESTEVLQLHFTLALPQPISDAPLLTSLPPSTTPLSEKKEMTNKEKDDSTTELALSVIKEDDITTDTNPLVDQSNVEDVKDVDLTKFNLEQLTFVEQIESGYVSIVWKGKLDDDTSVAIRELKSYTISTADFLEQTTIMNKLTHSNILKLYGVCTTYPIYIIMELMTNSLFNYLCYEAQDLQLSTMISASMQIAEGMDYLHKQRCIHRNLSAKNILVSENLICKISGFELAKIVDNDVIKVDLNFKFPIRWTACETFTSYPHESTFKSDVWSFGILLWEISTFGCLPYPCMANTQVQEEVVEGYRMPCPSMNLMVLYASMLKCWRESPADRPNFEDLSSELKELLTVCDISDSHLNKDNILVNVGSTTEENPIYGCIVVHKEEDITNFEQNCEMALITWNYSFECSQNQSIKLTKRAQFANYGKQHVDTYEGLWNKTTPVLVKIYSTHSTSTLNTLQQAANIAKLNHPNIIQFYAVFQARRALYAVTEFMKTDLLTYLRCTDQSLHLSQTVSMTLEIVKGMIYIEDKKYTLRNLKASSIMLSNNSVCKICNLDLAANVEDCLITDPLTKFPIRWTAPEAIIYCRFSIKSDVWSFGILLWELVTHGCLPYPKMTTCQVREQLFQGYRMPCPSKCPDNLFSIILECWNENPDRRPTFTGLHEILNLYLQEINKLAINSKATSKLSEMRDENTKKSDSTRNEALTTHAFASEISLPPTSPLDDRDTDDIHITGDLTAQNHVKNPMYEAILDYDSQDDSELSFKKNDLIEIQQKHSDWYWGCSRATGAEGYIPSSFISNVPVLSFLKKINEGKYNAIWAGIWNGETSVTIKEESNTVCYTKDILELRHPNIAHIYAVYVQSYIVMEPISQGKLNEVLQSEGKTLKFPQLITMSTQIAAGMAYLEENNCIHRHLAARNILVGDNLACKISNFSAAKIITRFCEFTIYEVDNEICIFEDQQFTRMAIKWAAPESMTTQKFSSKSDVWSYGVLLSEIVTCGNMPYPHMTNEQVLEGMLKGYRMPRPKGCPEKLYNIMLDCWKAELVRRPSFRSLQNQLETYFE